ncbi:amidohydrolase family protein [Arthrobacter sp. Br18]|uniref:amidohydrolase family protein n=1 Tax=Arthrobacter sp. Br18 TaxID=1312954 RepID=UPI001C1E27A0|nr:amidohydrolase family protein [Arthrobacter sp. Br18]
MSDIRVIQRPRPTAIRAAGLFDGQSFRQASVVILDGPLIASVGTGEYIPEYADPLDLGPVTLLPGLIDTHTHLAFDAGADPVGTLAARTDAEVVVAMRRAGHAALAGGVTTLRDLGDLDYLSLQLRGSRGFPTLVAAGPPITSVAGHCHFLGGTASPGEQSLRAAVREHADHGVDVIKIMATGGNLTPGSRQESAQFSAAEIRAAVDEAHRAGLPVTAHAHGTPGIANAITAGVDGMEHVSFWSATGVDEPGDFIHRIISQRIVVGATVGIRPVEGLRPPDAVLRRLPFIEANLRRMYEAGAVLAAGTDGGIAPTKPHDVVRYALPQLMDAGMGAAEALQMITSAAAATCGLSTSKGRIEAGYDADLLAVRGNPLEDPASIHDIAAVFSRGTRVC